MTDNSLILQKKEKRKRKAKKRKKKRKKKMKNIRRRKKMILSLCRDMMNVIPKVLFFTIILSVFFCFQRGLSSLMEVEVLCLPLPPASSMIVAW